MNNIKNKDVAAKFQSYPRNMRKKLLRLRQLILQVAYETRDVGELEETLKWGEPSYLTRNGSTVRIAWKESRPDQYAMYFNCNTKLIDTFREIYADTFRYEGNREIQFHENDNLNTTALKHCIELSLRYHKLKHLPLLGA